MADNPHFLRREIRYGKYAGRTLGDVARLDPGWIEWAADAIKSPKMAADVRATLRWLEEHERTQDLPWLVGVTRRELRRYHGATPEEIASEGGVRALRDILGALPREATGGPIHRRLTELLAEQEQRRAVATEKRTQLGAADIVLERGKYRGRTLADVARTDPEYALWAIDVPDLGIGPTAREEARRIANERLEKLAASEEPWKFPGGLEHAGRTLTEIVERDPAYYQWILSEFKTVDPRFDRDVEKIGERIRASTVRTEPFDGNLWHRVRSGGGKLDGVHTLKRAHLEDGRLVTENLRFHYDHRSRSRRSGTAGWEPEKLPDGFYLAFGGVSMPRVTFLEKRDGELLKHADVWSWAKALGWDPKRERA